MRELEGKRLLLLGSNVWKDIIKQFADEYGVKLIFAGLYPAQLDSMVSEYYRIDTTDPEVMIPFIKEHNIDGVYMGGSELIISHSCDYINKLGLPCYCTKQQWDYLQDKAQFKELCIKSGLPVVPKYEINPDDIKNSVPETAYPVITKPTDGSGSNGFSVCHNAEELVAGYKIASENSFSGNVICEKFVNNTGLVVFYSFSEGKMTFALTEDKYPVKYDKQGSYVAGLFLCESRFEDEFRRRYEDKVEKMFQSIGIKEGTIWIEIFHDGDDFYFNEVGYRYGGSFSFYSVDYMHGINQFYADLYYAASGKSKLYGFKSLIPETVERGKHYCIYPVHANPGKIAEIKGLNEIRNWENVAIVPQQKAEGDSIADSGSFGQVVLLVHFTFDSLDECKATIDAVHDTLRVISDKGENLVNRKLDFEESNVVY